MAAKAESPLISAGEFCYAAGLGCKIMQIPQEKVQHLIEMDSFLDLKQQIQEMTKDADAAFDVYPNGKRLQSLILGCRFKGLIDEEIRELFRMGVLDE